MKLSIEYLRRIILEELTHCLLTDDETFKQDSVLVPNEIKDKIKDYLKKMKLA